MPSSPRVAARDESARARHAAARRPSFTSGGDVFREIQQDVEAVLARRGTRTRAYIKLWAKAIIAVTLTITAWTVLVTGSRGIVIGIACLLALGLGAMLIGFCVQHDANHGASFGTRRFNRLVGFSTDALLGFSQLHLARQAQRRPPHVHERRRLRRRHQPGAPRPSAAGAGAEAVVPAAAVLHLAHVQPDGAATAVRRRRRCARCAAGSARAGCGRRADGISRDSCRASSCTSAGRS